MWHDGPLQSGKISVEDLWDAALVAFNIHQGSPWPQGQRLLAADVIKCLMSIYCDLGSPLKGLDLAAIKEAAKSCKEQHTGSGHGPPMSASVPAMTPMPIQVMPGQVMPHPAMAPMPWLSGHWHSPVTMTPGHAGIKRPLDGGSPFNGSSTGQAITPEAKHTPEANRSMPSEILSTPEGKKFLRTEHGQRFLARRESNSGGFDDWEVVDKEGAEFIHSATANVSVPTALVVPSGTVSATSFSL